MNRCLISLGANIGNPAEAITSAAARLREEFGAAADEFRLSRLYKTPPVGGPTGQPPFVNAVAAVHTPHDPWTAWHIVRKIESELGRVRQRRWEARRIDLDVLLHSAHLIWTPHFKVPHPRMCMRRFILVPAAEVAAEWREPVSGQTIGDLANRLSAGPGSLLVIADSSLRAGELLQEAARQALAGWRFTQLDDHDRYQFLLASPLPANASQRSAPPGGADNLSAHARWVSLIEPPQPLRVRPKLAADSTGDTPPDSTGDTPPGLAALGGVVGDTPSALQPGTHPHSVPSGTHHHPLGTHHPTAGDIPAIWQPKLTVYMPPSSPDADAAWEDTSREWAEHLGMKAPSRDVTAEAVSLGRAKPTGPVYLLPADDRQWAVHELVAALEAMDCPIEPIT